MQNTYLKWLTFVWCCLASCYTAAQEHPRILANPAKKQTILEKTAQQGWAQSIFSKTVEELEPFIERHRTDPDWILSRYLMNRADGRRYTRFISDNEGTQLIRYEGNAPYPTVRVSPHKRSPVTPEGGSYRVPEISELIPYDTAMTLLLQNNHTKMYERVDPMGMVGTINARFNEIVYKASVLFWLTDDVRYAKFAADLLDQWARGASFQQPIEGPGRVGFLNIQTLGDEASKYMVLAYDFLHPYLKAAGYNLSYYESVFEKIAQTLAYRGYTGNNWYAAESSTLVAAALALDNPEKQNYYLQYYLSKDTIFNGCGQLAMPSTVRIWLTDDGHWREPGGYHNYPVSKLLESGLMLENNGYDVFRRFPQLFKASYALIHYSFPNLTAAAYGDTGRPRQNMESLEIGLLMAERYKMPVFEEILSVMQLLQKEGYDRSKNDLTALLCYLPEIPTREMPPFQWERSDSLDFAKAYYQRNGMDPENGMMYVVQGATYNHNHANGMAMELYGKGGVAGADPGNGPNYEHPMHVGYYAVWAAHNTVVAAGRSSSTPRVRGGGGTKNIGQIELAAMEPMPKEKAISDHISFTDTKYFDASTTTHQRRTMVLIRTSETTGYYIDIYRSDNDRSNDYLYHNEGDTVLLYDEKGKQITTQAITYPFVEEDIPGLRHLQHAQTTGMYNQLVKAHFASSESKGGPRCMDVWIPASGNKQFYTASAPRTKTIDPPYNNLPTPVLTMRTEGRQNAWKDPFVAAFEPYRTQQNGTIEHISRTISDDGNQLVVQVKRKNGTETLFHSITNTEMKYENSSFRGTFSVLSFVDNQHFSLYLGAGNSLSFQDYQLVSIGEADISASLTVQAEKITVRASDPIHLIIQDPAISSVTCSDENGLETVVKRPKKGAFQLTLPKGTSKLLTKK